jgi:hypothetical protein
MADAPSNDPNTPSSDPNEITGAGIGVGILSGLGIVILVGAALFGLFKTTNGQYILNYLKYNLVSSTGKFFSFIPLILFLLGPLIDAINYQFEASKISIAAFVVSISEYLLGLFFGWYQGLASDNSLQSNSIFREFIPELYERCKVVLPFYTMNPTNEGGISSYAFISFFISFCYLISLSLINVYNNAQSIPQWWIGPVVMIGLSLFGVIVRTVGINSCDSPISVIYGISFAGILSAAYMAIAYWTKQSFMPFGNRLFASGTSASVLNATLPSGIKANTTSSCSAPKGEGVVYEIYQDGEMVGTV